MARDLAERISSLKYKTHKLRLRDLEGGGFLTFGNIFYVDSVTGSSANAGDRPDKAKATIAQGVALATANKGDVVVVLPGHSETVTAVGTVATAGVRIVGMGERNARPLITGSGTIDLFDITAAGVILENLRFGAPLVDAQTAFVNVAGAGVVLRDLFMIGSTGSENVVDGITLATGGDDCLIDGIRMFNVTVDMINGIDIEAAVARLEISNTTIEGAFSTAALKDGATATLAHIHHSTFKNTKAATAVVDFATGNTTGVMEHCFVSGRHTTIASNLAEGTGMDFHQVYVVEQAAVNGLLEPAVDAD